MFMNAIWKVLGVACTNALELGIDIGRASEPLKALSIDPNRGLHPFSKRFPGRKRCENA